MILSKNCVARPANSLSLVGCACLVFSLAVYCIGVSKAMQSPIASEEPVLPYAGQAFNARGTYDYAWDCTQASAASPKPQTMRRYYFHPPTYVFLVAKLGKFFGDYAFGARVLATLCVLLTAAFLCVQAFLVFGSSKEPWFWTWVVGSTYLVNPVTIRSSTVIDSDASIFTLCLAGFNVAMLLLLKKRGNLKLLLVALAWFFCLMSKMTMAVLLPGVLIVFYGIRFKRFPSFREVLWACGFTALVFGMFLLVLRFVQFPFSSLWDYLLDRFFRYTAGASFLEGLKGRGLSFLDTSIWMGPFSIALFLAAVGVKFSDRWRRHGDASSDFICLIALVFVFGHVLVGGTYNRFPRFMTPGLPGLCLIAVWMVFRMSGSADISFGVKKAKGFLAMAFGVLWYWVVVGDYLAAVLFKPHAILRGLMHQSFPVWVAMTFFQLILYALPFLLVLLRSIWARIPAGYLYVIPVLIASFIGMDIVQVHAEYDTYYSYGLTGIRQAMQKTNALPADRAIMAPCPFVFYRADALSTYHLDYEWFDDKIFLKKVSHPKMQAIVYTPMDFPVTRARELQSSSLVSALQKLGYRQEWIGSYILWIRE